MLRLYPLYKELAHDIANGHQAFFTDEELAIYLDENIDSKQFQFAKLNLIRCLLDNYKIDFIRAEDENLAKGYKIASSEETVKISAKRLQKKIKATARKQRKVLGVVDRPALTEDTKLEYDAYLIRGGLLAAFLAQTPLKRCLEGIQIRFDRPKIIKK